MPDKQNLPFGPKAKATAFLKRTTDHFVIKRRGFSRRQLISYGLTALIVLLIGFYALRIVLLKDFAAQSKSQIYAQLEEARQALRNLDPAGAREPLSNINEELLSVQDEANKYGVLTMSKGWGLVSDKIQAIPSMLQNLVGISGTAIHLNDDIAFLKENAAQLMIDRRGPEMIERLKGFRDKLHRLTDYLNQLDNSNGNFDDATLRSLGDLRAEIDRNNEALGSLIAVLDAPAPRHVLLLFQNQTEMRPGGGFIGSYAHIELSHGSINDIEIRDIYDPDGQLDQRLIPPEALQQITKDWEARDANWFFDYPTSAKKVISFLNNSKIYQEQKKKFTDAVAINTNVLQNLVTLIGPIELPEYKLTITPANFLREVQREVESGADKKVNQPKRIIKVLTPLILHELTTLDAAEKKELARLLKYHLAQRDIMVYSSDPALHSYVRSQGVAGDVLQANQNVVNEYLAVVNANVGGAKSDAYVSQKIDFKSSITETGEIHNTLTVNRRHAGNKQKEWWYRSANRNYMQVFTTLGSRLTGAAGRSFWPRTPARDYRGYATDSDLAGIEQTRRYLDEFGVDRTIISDKTVFAAWVSTAAGTSTQYVLEYSNPRNLNPNSNTPYEFVFEKQSGASTTLSISIAAPPKYKWKEINQGVIEYQTQDPPGRIRIRQTLIPIE